MKPFYYLASQIVIEKAFYAMFPFWREWIIRQTLPNCEVVQGIMGYCTELFDHADRQDRKILKVVDCQNSHPTSYRGYWQRELDLWCPGKKVPIPDWMFSRMNQELQRADMVLCPSDFVRDTMIANGISPQKCFVSHFGVNTNLFSRRVVPPKSVRFVCIGTVCVRKGHQYLFRAFEKLRRILPDAELVCVGGYKDDFAKERGRWEGSFTLYDKLSPDEVAEILKSSTAFILPSLEEGFARVISEAMAVGLPIIASYESGASTVVRDGEEGYIIRPQDIDALAEVMIRVANDLELNQRMAEASYQKGSISNTWLDYGDRLLAEYKRRLEL
jgi:glycosyltransferase involved in cell wall biosynthesis